MSTTERSLRRNGRWCGVRFQSRPNIHARPSRPSFSACAAADCDDSDEVEDDSDEEADDEDEANDDARSTSRMSMKRSAPPPRGRNMIESGRRSSLAVASAPSPPVASAPLASISSGT